MPATARGWRRRAPAAAAVAILLATTGLPAAKAGYRSIFDLPPDPVTEAIRGGTPEGLPGPGALDPVANTLRTWAKDSESAQARKLDEETTLNAIALSRASGVPFNVPEIGNTDLARRRSAEATQSILILPLDVAAVLTLGVPRLPGSLYDVLSYSREFRTRDIVNQQVEITDEHALGGVALLANGFHLDPHDLVEFEATARGGTATRSLAGTRPDPVLEQTTNLPFVTAASASASFFIAEPFEPLALADFVLNNSDRGSASLDMDLPLDHVFFGIALRNNGLPVEAHDLMSARLDASVSRVDTIQLDYDIDDTFNALLLGGRVA